MTIKVRFWDYHPNGMTAFINEKHFSDIAEAHKFKKSVNGVIACNSWAYPK